MKNLKKLTRKGLDELAKQMPEMKVAEQSECVGAYRYYCNTGDGSKGSSIWDGGSDEIRITNTTGFGYLAEGYTPLAEDILPYTNNDICYKIVCKQVLDEVIQVYKPGISSGSFWYIDDYENFFIDVTMQDPRIKIYIPSGYNGMHQNYIDNIPDAINALYASGTFE